MKNRTIIFAIAMLLPNLALACGGSSDGTFGSLDILSKIQFVLNWVIIIAMGASLIAFIVLSLVLACKKNQENKKMRSGIVSAVVFLVFDTIVSILNTSYFYVGILFFIPAIIIILILDLKCIKNKSEKRMKWWIIFTFSVLFLSLFALIVVNSIQTIAPLDSANF